MKPGTRIGAYEITGALGAGGMGEVYRARDTRLNRDVALKVLPEALVGDAERLSRFEHEARSLAALNHPNIAQVYGLEQGDSTVIVMELVEGEDLAARLQQGPLPIDEILPIARQVAEALEAAHEAGIVHRDLKPANVRLRPDGTAKVLDFGLAKSTEGAGVASGSAADSPTIMSPAVTGVGVIMGTAAYMAPEQARGKPVDRRADVWAFGCLLFELLAGQRAFGGDDVSMTLASVLKKDIDWSMLPADTPVPLRRMIERCLEVEPRRRYQSIGDARVQIEDWINEGFDVGFDAGVAVAEARGANAGRSPAVLAGGALLLAVVAAAAGWLLRPAAEAPLRVLQLDAETTGTAGGPADVSTAAMLPDGSAVVIRRGEEAWLHRLDGADPRLLADRALAVALSPDGTQIFTDSYGTLAIVSVVTGSVTRLSEAPFYAPYGMHWTPSGRVLLSKGGDFGMQAVDLTTGELTPVLALAEGDTRFLTPQELPNGDIMFSSLSRGRIEVFDGTARHQLLDVAGATVESATYSPAGYVLWSQWGSNEGVWAAPYSLEQRAFTDEPRQISTTVGSLSVSRNGLLVILPRDSRAGDTAAVFVVDRDGEPIRQLTPPTPSLRQPRLSPDGRFLALQVQSSRTGNSSVLVYDLERDISIELGAGAPAGNTGMPEWMPDGSAVVYLAGPLSNRAMLREDRAGSPTPVTLVPEGVRNVVISVSADGRWVFYSGTDGNIWYVPTDGGDPVRFRDSRDTEEMASISPDGRYLAFGRSSSTGTSGMFIERFPDGGDAQVVDTGWDDPHWSPDGREFYWTGNRDVHAVSFDPETGQVTSRPQPLFDNPPTLAGFDVGPDGTFVIPRPPLEAADEEPASPIVIENWRKLLER